MIFWADKSAKQSVFKQSTCIRKGVRRASGLDAAVEKAVPLLPQRVLFIYCVRKLKRRKLQFYRYYSSSPFCPTFARTRLFVGSAYIYLCSTRVSWHFTCRRLFHPLYQQLPRKLNSRCLRSQPPALDHWVHFLFPRRLEVAVVALLRC